MPLAMAGCPKDDGGDGDGDGDGDSGGYWAVGAESQMLRVADGAIDMSYDLDLPGDPDLYGIECRGLDEAWVVGAGGTVLTTTDGGRSWDTRVSGVFADLRGVAVDGEGRVWAVGDRSVLRSEDEGTSWASWSAAPLRDFAAVDTSGHGELTLAVDATGGLWQFSADGAQELASVGVPLRDVSVAHDGRHALAVGDAGVALVSHDGGTSFSAVDLGVDENILAASVSHDGLALSAVTEQGRVVIVDDLGIHLYRPGEKPGALWDVHQVSALELQAAGEGGRIVWTVDGGASWRELQADPSKALFGIDRIDGSGHH